MRLLVIVCTAAVALAAAGPVAAQPAALQASTVKVTAKDFSFTLSTRVVKTGRITFVIRNAGASQHDFAIAGHRSKTIGHGETTRLMVTLKPGRYLYRCTVDSHAMLGMKGYLQVHK
jgi:plastocyanin